MANAQEAVFYPQATGNPTVDYAFRIAFDDIYGLQNQLAQGLSGTLTLPAGAEFNGKAVTRLVLTNGQITSAT